MRGAVLLIVVAAVAADAAGLRGRGAAEAAAGGTPAGYTLPAVSSGKKHAMTSAQTLGFFIKANEGAGTGSGRGYAGTVLPQKLHVTKAGNMFMQPAVDREDNSQTPDPQPLQGDFAVPDAPTLGLKPVYG